MRSRGCRQSGFAWLHFAVLIAGLSLAWLRLAPDALAMLERRRALEAFRFGEELLAAQRAQFALTGSFQVELGELGLDPEFLAGFSTAGVTCSNPREDWCIRLVRSGTSGGFGAYAVWFDQRGFDAARSTVPRELWPAALRAAPPPAP